VDERPHAAAVADDREFARAHARGDGTEDLPRCALQLSVRSTLPE